VTRNDTDDDYGKLPGRRFQALDLLVVGTQTLSDIIGSVADGMESLSDLLAAHANRAEEQDDFARSAGRDIERMTGDGS
jgi:hypothetical protein